MKHVWMCYGSILTVRLSSDTTNRNDLTEAGTDMTVSQPLVNPTHTREPAMSLCLNDWQTRLPVPSILDLSSAIDRMTPPQSKGKGFSLGLRGGGLILVPE